MRVFSTIRGFKFIKKKVEYPFKSEVDVQNLLLDSCKIVQSQGHHIS